MSHQGAAAAPARAGAPPAPAPAAPPPLPPPPAPGSCRFRDQSITAVARSRDYDGDDNDDRNTTADHPTQGAGRARQQQQLLLLLARSLGRRSVTGAAQIRLAAVPVRVERGLRSGQGVWRGSAARRLPGPAGSTCCCCCCRRITGLWRVPLCSCSRSACVVASFTAMVAVGAARRSAVRLLRCAVCASRAYVWRCCCTGKRRLAARHGVPAPFAVPNLSLPRVDSRRRRRGSREHARPCA